MENKRIVNTPFYTKAAHEILDSVIGQLSDGWGENNAANDKWWMFANVETAPDGRIVIEVDGRTSKLYCGRAVYNAWSGMTDGEILAKFAALVKKTMQMELKDENVKGGWKRDNVGFTTRYLSNYSDVTVAQVYCVYDILLGRDVDSKFQSELLESVFGEAKAADETAAEIARREADRKIEEKLAAARKTVDEWRKAEIARIEAEAGKRVEKYLEEYRAAKAGVRKAVA